jgi:hypothetical protein
MKFLSETEKGLWCEIFKVRTENYATSEDAADDADKAVLEFRKRCAPAKGAK